MNWDDLKVFLSVADAGSVRGAAKNLGISHSTVSRRLDALETDLGVRLFDRLSKGYVPTAPGEEIAAFASDMLDNVNELQRHVVGADSRLTGTIRVTMPDLLACHLLMPDIVRFSHTYPDIDVDLVLSYETLSITNREADVAVRITDKPAEHLVGRKVGRYVNAVYATVDYLKRTKPEDRQWIGWGDRATFPAWVRESAFPDIPSRGSYNNSMAQFAAAKAGLGIAMLPCFMCDPEPTLVRVVQGLAKPAFDVWVLTHPDLRDTARIRSFMRHTADAFDAKRNLLMGLSLDHIEQRTVGDATK